MNSFALYHLPHAAHYVRLVQHSLPRRFASIEAAKGAVGFLIAPFEASEATPVVLMEAESTRTCALPPASAANASRRFAAMPAADSTSSREAYSRAFEKAHEALEAGDVKKLVLSRTRHVALDETCTDTDLEQLFFRACLRYPTCYVTLFRTPHTGTWLIATPELLLDHANGRCATIALAGTMLREDKSPWSLKNREEQALVASYIYERIAPMAEQAEESAPWTYEVGSLKHLRTDFRFSLLPAATTPQLLAALHPTPAVCGVPLATARRLLLTIEPASRYYYAGYTGPTSPTESHLYVSLRCMHLAETEATLYAGGGILLESNEDEEWEETCRKMQPMMGVLGAGG